MAKRSDGVILGGFTEAEAIVLAFQVSGMVDDPEVRKVLDDVRPYTRDGYVDIEGECETLYKKVLSKLNDEKYSNKKVVKILIDFLGIWLPVDYYTQLPIARRVVVRDPKCRPHGKKSERTTDVWGTPNSDALLLDDNSLIKGIVHGMPVVNGRNVEIGTIDAGFVASHIWRHVKGMETNDDLASRDPVQNSFIPNLLWLPREVSKMTDVEGSFAQKYIQALSRQIYGNADFANKKLGCYANQVYAQFPEPRNLGVELPDVSTLNFFRFKQKHIERKIEDLDQVIQLMKDVIDGRKLPKDVWVITHRYGPGLVELRDNGGKAAIEKLYKEVREYRELFGPLVNGVKLKTKKQSKRRVENEGGENFEAGPEPLKTPTEKKANSNKHLKPKGKIAKQERNHGERVKRTIREDLTVGALARHAFATYLTEMQPSKEMMENLQSGEYGKKTFRLNPAFPVLVLVKGQNFDDNRYNKLPVVSAFDGLAYRISSQWYERIDRDNRTGLERWIVDNKVKV